MEYWRVIEDNTAYEVSNLGRIRNIRTQLIANTWQCGNTLMVTLYNAEKCKRKNYKVSKLVVSAFLNLHDVAIIHLNEDKTDCRLDNLFCCSHSEACEWHYGKPVIAISKYYRIYFSSIAAAARAFSISSNTVRYCCTNNTETKDGVRFKYDKD